MSLAECEGVTAGVCASALHSVRLLGQERFVAYTHHMRVDPAFQRQGMVHGRGEIAIGIDQRSIEVEADRGKGKIGHRARSGAGI